MVFALAAARAGDMHSNKIWRKQWMMMMMMMMMAVMTSLLRRISSQIGEQQYCQ